MEEQKNDNRPDEENSSQKKSFHLNFHIVLIAAILIIAAVSIIKLVIWNNGTKSNYDPDHLSEGFDVEVLDTIIPLSSTKLEGHTDDGVHTILCLGNSAVADGEGNGFFTAQLASKTGATVYNGAFPFSRIGARNASYSGDYLRDAFNLPYVAKSICAQDFGQMEYAASFEEDARFAAAVGTLKSLDYGKIDTIVIMYDATDYTEGTAVENPNDPHELTTYTGALRTAVQNIQETYPYIRIIVMSHTFAHSLDEQGNFMNGDTTDLGNGPLPHYLAKEVDVAIEMGVSIIDNYYGTVSEDNYQDYMTDYLHYNDKGREALADRLAEVINTGRTSAK